jgi:uncharacterized protein YdbL (DUF1318 family)
MKPSKTRNELLSDALKAAAVASQLTSSLLALTVEEARDAGLTWDQIATALGVTRQAASQRYGR